MIYLDNAATTPLCPAARDEMIRVLTEEYGNPSSAHGMGQRAAGVLFSARKNMARLLCCQPNELFFTSCGSEGNTMALMSAAAIGVQTGRRHIISQKTEHHSVLNALEALRKRGFETTLLDVDGYGMVSPESLRAALRRDTAFVTIMTANNETGTIQPIKELAAICRENDVLFHTDAVQAAGHIPLDMRDIGCDMLTLSAHKFHGAKGAGALYVRQGIPVSSVIFGGGQERGKRGGTENVAAIAGMSAALEYSLSEHAQKQDILTEMRNILIRELTSLGAVLNGHPEKCLAGTVNLSFGNIAGERMVYELNRRGICASTGSACTSGMSEASHVMTAMRKEENLALGAVRFSLSLMNTIEEINETAAAVKEILTEYSSR